MSDTNRDFATNSGAVTLFYGDTPPSLNSMGTRSSRHVIHREKKRWEGVWAMLLLEASSRACEPLPRRLICVRATAVLRFPTRRRRDEGNYRWLGLEKCCGDALVKAGYLPDDTPEFFTFQSVTFDPERGPAQTTLALAYES